ncbi:hypothetical protein TRFO_05497 [Tritrichomonas foetus]|uniref:Peptidase C1A papain C-terminal domain-containing protein n=1 Tax=Tritrichomonas foetus TaxID=1144522 RepID=A0A1J4K6I6_9EUKA|nr:hypothetical protein TRFO_05497 [Tritrichomonas foetus]|eukprot:OHT06795.1 hypothetical protein TRFO_05497 [Tritrichomonas foetus]
MRTSGIQKIERGDPLLVNEQQNSGCNNRCMTIFLIVLDIILIPVLVVSLYFSMQALKKSKDPIPSPLDYLAQQYADALPDSFLPDHFRVDPIYYFPATNQYSRGTCWAFSTIYLLMTQYRAQGIRQGYMKEDEYVNISVQAFTAFLGNWCKAHPTEKVCGYGGFLKDDSTNDNQIEALKYFYEAISELAKSILPESVCPYTHVKDPSTDFKCDGFDEAVKNNPIEFKIKSMRTVYDVRGVKQLLYDAQRPLGIGIGMASMDFFVPCEGSVYADKDQCVKKEVPCPYAQDGSYCYVLTVSGRTGDAIFATSENIERITQSGGHAMNIVGYNDNWRFNDRFAPSESIAEMKGTFILHNSWGATPGHSIDFLVGDRTLENEEMMCPNHDNPLNWIPGDYDCVVQNNGDHTKCGTEIHRIRGKGRTMHSDLLVCKNTAFCKQDGKYILQGKSDAETEALSNGLHNTKFIDVTDPSNISSVTITYPFWALNQILKPNPEEYVPNDPFDCGFYALPYKTLEMYRRRSWDLFDNFKVSDIEIEFSPSSYRNAPEAQEKDLTWLNESTWTLPKVEFDGPIPFDAIYK